MNKKGKPYFNCRDVIYPELTDKEYEEQMAKDREEWDQTPLDERLEIMQLAGDFLIESIKDIKFRNE